MKYRFAGHAAGLGGSAVAAESRARLDVLHFVTFCCICLWLVGPVNEERPEELHSSRRGAGTWVAYVVLGTG